MIFLFLLPCRVIVCCRSNAEVAQQIMWLKEVLIHVGEAAKTGRWDNSSNRDSPSPAWRWGAWPGWPDAARWGRPAGGPWLLAARGRVRRAVWALRGVTTRSTRGRPVVEEAAHFHPSRQDLQRRSLLIRPPDHTYDPAGLPSESAQSQGTTSERLLSVITANRRGRPKQGSTKPAKKLCTIWGWKAVIDVLGSCVQGWTCEDLWNFPPRMPNSSLKWGTCTVFRAFLKLWKALQNESLGFHFKKQNFCFGYEGKEKWKYFALVVSGIIFCRFKSQSFFLCFACQKCPSNMMNTNVNNSD